MHDEPTVPAEVAPDEYVERVLAASLPATLDAECPCPGCALGDPDCPCAGCVADRELDATEFSWRQLFHLVEQYGGTITRIDDDQAMVHVGGESVILRYSGGNSA